MQTMTKAKRATIYCAEIYQIINGKHPEIAIVDAERKIKASKVMTFADKSAKD